ncbi:hypothetical protein AMOR_18510 [Anaeromyxobacter oryzae]|uniref:Uncharacterized protein n=1 Tax=Anaeromyxobacter oryzae TaxID=2918170 RepID=A0ABN6MPE8_9BACT|nr:hypothetical protein AMOR_18510 [Anaeromyxobacter oryzae]
MLGPEAVELFAPAERLLAFPWSSETERKNAFARVDARFVA